jgi:hypothetical protein
LAKTASKGSRGKKAEENTELPTPAKRGRPRGKRSDPAFEPIYAYIRVETHKEVKIRLIREGDKDLSELLEELLTQWLKSRN